MAASLTLGRYAPFKTFIHKLDARVKLFALICLMVPVFLNYGGLENAEGVIAAKYSMTFIINGLLLLFAFICLLIAKGSILGLLKSLRHLWFMAIFVLIIYSLIPRTADTDWIAFHIGSFPIYWASLLDAAKILIRLVSMITLMMVFTSSTKPLEMTDAFEWYLTPFKWIGLPTHELAMILSIALRFIPTILEDTQRIMNAQASRGVDFKYGGPVTKVRAVISLIIPLFVSAFIRSEELADAMECRGYDPRGKRTKYRVAKFTWRDIIGTLAPVILLGLAIAASVTHFDVFALFGLVVR